MTLTQRIEDGLRKHPDWTNWRISRSHAGATAVMVAEIREKMGMPPRERSAGPKVEKQDKSLQATLFQLKAEIANLAEKRAAKTVEIGKKAPPYRFGVLSCTHFGSNYEEVGITKACYDWFKQEGVSTVYHCGDMTEGVQMRKGHEHEVHKHGADDQIRWTVEKYPYVKGITTYLISGNHDAAHIKNGGTDVCEHIARQREDINYLGADYGRFAVQRTGERDIVIDLMHPGGGSAYACSYKLQKIIESLEAGTKPDVLLVGHFHKALTMPTYRGVAGVLAGCTQRQTGFMRNHGLAAHVGCHIIEVRNLDGSVVVSSCWRSWFPSAV